MDVADELDSIEILLRMVPDLQRAGRLVEGAQSDSPGVVGYRDQLARWAQTALGINLDAGIEDEEARGIPFTNLCDVPDAPSTVIDAARWRLRRLSRLMELFARQSQP